MEKPTREQIAGMIDATCVRADHTIEEIENLIEASKKYKFAAAFTLPCYTKMLKDGLAGVPEVAVGGVVGYPSGADTLNIKLKQLDEMLELGADEIDMMINLGLFKSGKYDTVGNEIREIKRICGDKPVKCIIEICYLTDEQIGKASQIVQDAGADFVKTGTGWGPKPTTVDTIKTIRKAVGNDIKIKAAGGIRGLGMMMEMKEAGCDRFGFGLKSALDILENEL